MEPFGVEQPIIREAAAREQTLRLLRERIFRYAASRVQRETAEDLAQETMLLIHEKYGHLEDPADLLPLAFQILRLKMTAAFRKSNRRGEGQTLEVEGLPLADPGPNPEDTASRLETEERLRSALLRLGERCREIFRLKLLGYGFEEIRRHFGVVSINTVYTWDVRCRKSLLERLGGRWEASR